MSYERGTSAQPEASSIEPGVRETGVAMRLSLCFTHTSPTSLFLSLSFCLSLSLCSSLSHTRTLTHSRAHTHTHTRLSLSHTHTHTHTHTQHRCARDWGGATPPRCLCSRPDLWRQFFVGKWGGGRHICFGGGGSQGGGPTVAGCRALGVLSRNTI